MDAQNFLARIRSNRSYNRLPDRVQDDLAKLRDLGASSALDYIEGFFIEGFLAAEKLTDEERATMDAKARLDESHQALVSRSWELRDELWALLPQLPPAAQKAVTDFITECPNDFSGAVALAKSVVAGVVSEGTHQ